MKKYLERIVLRKSNIQNVATVEAQPCVAGFSCLASGQALPDQLTQLFHEFTQRCKIISSFREGGGSSITIPTPPLHWSRRQNISACPLVASVPKITLCSTGRSVSVKKRASHLSAALQHPWQGLGTRFSLKSLLTQSML